jgi:hypothetical protein
MKKEISWWAWHKKKSHGGGGTKMKRKSHGGVGTKTKNTISW